MNALQVLLISFLLLVSVAVAAKPFKTPGVRYVILDTTHGAYNGLINAARAIQESTRSNSVLSIFLSNDGLQALVKLIGTTPAWRSGNLTGNPAVLEVYESNAILIDLIGSDPNWKRESNLE